MRQIRRAAGEIRRCDVLGELFGERARSATGDEVPALEYVVSAIQTRREEALEGIADAGRGKARKKLARASRKLAQ